MPLISKQEYAQGIFTLRHFLSPEECGIYIDQANMIGFEAAKVGFPTGAVLNNGIRNNERVSTHDAALAAHMYERACIFLPSTYQKKALMGFSAQVRYYRYTPSQRFKMHRDGSYEDGKTQSHLTFLVYLNDVTAGGETRFREPAIPIVPECGMALIFPHALWHEGCPVTKGEKYVLRFDVLYGS